MLAIDTRSASKPVRSSTDEPRSRSLDPFQVLGRAGVDPDLLARLDERRDLHLQTGLQGRFLVLIGGRRTRQRRGVSDTVSSTESGISIETGLSLMYLTITFALGSKNCIAVPMISWSKCNWS